MAASDVEVDESIARINVTPLVDVMLVLLIILLVTAKQITSQSVPLDFPKTSGGPAQPELVLSVVLAADGATRIDGRTVASDDDLLPLANEARAKNAAVRAVIQADGAVSHGRVIHALDLLKQAHVDKIGFKEAR